MSNVLNISYWKKKEELYCNIKDITPIELKKLSILNHKIKLKERLITFKILLYATQSF